MSKTETLLGEVVTWNGSGKSNKTIAYADIIKSLRAAHLKEEAAQELAPRNAFSRACKHLTDQRIIRKVKEDDDEIEFQFTKEVNTGTEIIYTKELTLILRKAIGQVICTNSALEKHAQSLLDFHVQNRTSSDVTRIVQKLFQDNADLFAIREQGGAYFVPISFQNFTMQIEQFISALGGKMKRFPVPKGYSTGEAAAKDAIAQGLNDLIVEHDAAIDEFTSINRKSTLENCAEKIRITKFKIEAYAAYLDDRKEALIASVEEARERLQAKMLAIDEANSEE